MGFIKTHRAHIASSAVVAIAVGTIVALAVNADGQRARKVDLNDGGVWVTSNADGLIGRLNKPIQSLDAALYPPGGAQQDYHLDVAQDGSSVLGWDQSAGSLYVIDPELGAANADASIPAASTSQVDVRGDTIALYDAVSATVWAQRVTDGVALDSLSQLDPSAAPVAELGPKDADGKPIPPSDDADQNAGGAMAVGVDGKIHVVTSAGQVATVAPTVAGFAKPVEAGSVAGYGALQITAVGAETVVLDPTSGHLYLPNGTAVDIESTDGTAMIQLPSGPASQVYVETGASLIAVNLGDGSITELSTSGTGTPTKPAVLGECVYAAWAGQPGVYEKSCNVQPAASGNIKDLDALVQPVFRINRGFVVLNDLATGAVWDLDTQQRVDNWSNVRPPPIQADSDTQNDENISNAPNTLPPRAVDDLLGARPGRATMLYVLDNDSDPGGHILSITSITTPDSPDAAVQITPDGQAIQVTLPSDAVNDVHFEYTADDGFGQSTSAKVTVEVRSPSENSAPHLRTSYQAKAWTISAGGNLSLPVLSDWRDDDGDPIALTTVTTTSGNASTTRDGRVDFRAALDQPSATLTYSVSDGIATPVPTDIPVTVQSPQEVQPVAAVAEPDVARGEVGKVLTITPLANDLPGVDPTQPDARMVIAGDVPSPLGTTITTDKDSGRLTVVADRPGTFVVNYSVAYGVAPLATAAIRIDIAAPAQTPPPPVAIADVGVIRGQLPTVVDVLANDFSPSGDVLSVQNATPVDPNSQLEIAIVRGKWLQIRATAAQISPNPQVVRYTIIDGSGGQATGEVTISQVEAPTSDPPVTHPDYATVRAGDSVSVSVLDNDTNSGGSPIQLLADVTGAATSGQLVVRASTKTDQTDLGIAYTVGNQVVYVAPESVTTPLAVTVDYVASDPNGNQSAGQLNVTVNPTPNEQFPNRAPTPKNIETRTISGATVTIRIPTTGFDPDGDSLTVVGITGAPHLGAIVKFSATTVTYQSFPTSVGTDTITYLVTDAYGATNTATINIGVAPPGQPQPPVAIPDVAVAAPGTTVTVDVMANDLIAPDDDVTVTPLETSNPDLPAGVSLEPDTGVVTIPTPDATGVPTVIAYAESNGLGAPSTTTVTLRSQEGFRNPPVVPDSFAQPDDNATSVSVDVLEKAYDPDGATSALTITRVFSPDADYSGSEITVQVGAQPKTVAFEVADESGATTVGIVRVGSVGAGLPYPIADGRITMDANSSLTFNIADYIVVPSGKQVRLTTVDRVSAAPTGNLTAANSGDTAITLTSANDYGGPGAVSFEVTDADSLTESNGRVVTISIPVQVGPPTPVLRCPGDTVSVVQGGYPVTLKVTSLCHVWAPDEIDKDSLSYTAEWTTPLDAVDIGGNGTGEITLEAAGTSVPGQTGGLTITVDGSAAVAATLNVTVIPAPPPTVAAMTIEGVLAGQSASIDVAQYTTSQLRDASIQVVTATQQSGMGANVTTSGSTVTVTPAADAHGTIIIGLVVSDVSDPSRTDRQTTAQITVQVLGVPDAPATPQIGYTVLSKSVELSWAAPANNGAPIDSFEVNYGSGTQTCAASPCLITGLTNGQGYTFTVRAHNLVGWGEPSPPSAQAIPNTVPDQVTGVTTSNPQDGALTVAWNPATVDGTPVLRYEVTWTGGGSATVTGTSFTATGLVNNNVYTFNVVAVNAQGPGPAGTGTGQSAGNPILGGDPSVSSTSSANKNTRTVVVSWSPADANGPGPATYTAYRDGTPICSNVTSTSCSDDGVPNDGATHTYTYAATNNVGKVSGQSGGATIEAAETPDAVTISSFTATGNTGEATVTFSVGASHGASATVTCTVNGNNCGSWTYPTSGQSGVSQTITGLANGSSATIKLQLCNGSKGGNGAGSTCGAPGSASTTPYGPLPAPTISTSAQGTTVNWSISANGNGKDATITVTNNGTTVWSTTASGAVSRSGSVDVGYSATANMTVTVSDPGRQSQSASSSATTEPPPPPPKTVQVSRGGTPPQCSGCSYVVVTVGGFVGQSSVQCTIENNEDGTQWTDTSTGKTYPNLATKNIPVDGNGNGSSEYALYAGQPYQVRATCDGITSAWVAFG